MKSESVYPLQRNGILVEFLRGMYSPPLQRSGILVEFFRGIYSARSVGAVLFNDPCTVCFNAAPNGAGNFVVDRFFYQNVDPTDRGES